MGVVVYLIHMMLKNIKAKGFTVLEFLIVLAIILLLIAIILPNLQKSREKSVEEKKVSDIKIVALGLEQYKQICGSYPEKIEKLATCPQMNSETNLGTFIPELDKLQFSVGSSEYLYYPISLNPIDTNECTGYHLAVKLGHDITGTNLSVGDKNFDSRTAPSCGNTSAVGFDGNDPAIFDIAR